LIQGPCKENQEIIVNSKFLEYAVSLLSEETRIIEMKQPATRSHYTRNITSKSSSAASLRKNTTINFKDMTYE